MVRKLSFLLIGMVALMLAACGGGGGTGTNGNASSAALDQSYDADGVTFKYPTGWVVQKPAAPGGPITLGNNQATLDVLGAGNSTKAESGQQAIIIYPFVGDAFKAISATITAPIDLLKQMAPAMSSGDNGLKFGDPVEATVGGNPAAKATGTSDAGDGKIIVIKAGDVGYVLVMGVTAKGELGNIEGTVDGLAETVAVKPAS
ncbi:MAG: hypothetical protein ABI690_17120 [Chloroflexota bacterium]